MTTATSTRAPFGILYEHPDWFRPLFTELELRGIPVKRLHAAEHWYDPSSPRPPYGLVFNRMSPSAYLRDAGHAVFLIQAYLAHLESHGVRVINGSRAYAVETSKALQLSLLRQLGLPHPRSRVISRAIDAPAAARGLRFPVVVKPNIGGSGAGVRLFDSADALTEASFEELELGVDHTGLVQEYVPAEDGRIVRVEVLGGSFLYGIRVYPTGGSFNLCPADVCQTVDGAELVRGACAVDAPKNGMKVEEFTPPAELIRAVESIARAAGIDVGGIEYFIDSRDGKPYFYDINALSNFVAEGPRVVGFDPFVRLVDWLEQEAA
jgi:glutathione synthase/RimK-type ligase-like ATP-grasp enzyme